VTVVIVRKERPHPGAQLIWLGICLLLSSGALLALDLASPLSWFKQALVLLQITVWHSARFPDGCDT